MLDLHIEQNILNLQSLERALSDKQITKIAIHHWKWQLATGKNPFESVYKYPHDESKWFNELHKLTVQYQAKVNIKETEYPLQRCLGKRFELLIQEKSGLDDDADVAEQLIPSTFEEETNFLSTENIETLRIHYMARYWEIGKDFLNYLG
jgi:hypothetical protein